MKALVEEVFVTEGVPEFTFVGMPKDLIGIRFQWDASDPKWKDSVVEDILLKLIDRIG